MWPLCFLLHKILEVQEGRSEERRDGDSISPKYSQLDDPFVTSHGNLKDPSSSHMEVPQPETLYVLCLEG
ncbi:hypothetical protein Bca101_045208 [Brassica carinata]